MWGVEGASKYINLERRLATQNSSTTSFSGQRGTFKLSRCSMLWRVTFSDGLLSGHDKHGKRDGECPMQTTKSLVCTGEREFGKCIGNVWELSKVAIVFIWSAYFMVR